MREETEIAVIGGGLVGAAIAWGLAQAGKRVTVLDEGDNAFRASRGNFALIWVQSKGLGMAPYSAWSVRSSNAWARLAAALKDETGIDVAHQRPGGLMLSLSEGELERRAAQMRRLHNQPEMIPYPYEVLDHAATRALLPEIGPQVAGSIYCPLDGHVNSLKLFRALHASLAARGVAYRPNRPVETIARDACFIVSGAWGEVRAEKIVLAAGNGSARLAPQVGLNAPVRPQRGQIIVTERAKPFLNYPLVTVRQTDEGTVMIGDSLEEVGFENVATTAITATEADRAVRMFPLLAGLNVVRTWSALRVMSQDGFPIYDQSTSHPGAFLATCHSGVTLAANHAFDIAPQIAAGALSADLLPFSARRFHVPQAA
ncbi:MAG TPA: FAD-dependent oxidoreductase [Xanthobacteraceae bacterium]|nr:FAD-dependent oxidoreductase [Xanthobacteraceae bacterium]